MHPTFLIRHDREVVGQTNAASSRKDTNTRIEVQNGGLRFQDWIPRKAHGRRNGTKYGFYASFGRHIRHPYQISTGRFDIVRSSVSSNVVSTSQDYNESWAVAQHISRKSRRDIGAYLPADALVDQAITGEEVWIVVGPLLCNGVADHHGLGRHWYLSLGTEQISMDPRPC